MPCCLLTVIAFFPRIALVVMWLGGYAQTAFQSFLWPLIGFFFLPYTTCAYAVAMNETGGIRGWTLILLIICIVLDFGHLGGGGAYGSRRYRVRA